MDESEEEISDDDDGDSMLKSCTTSSQARSSLEKLRNIIEKCDGINQKEFSALTLVDNLIDKNYYSHKVQTKITDFFKK